MSRGRAAVAAGLLLLLAGGSSDDDASTSSSTSVSDPAPTTYPPSTLPAESPCTDEVAVSPRRSDGGHYRQGAPAKDTLLEPGVTGTRLVISGYVLFPDCRTVPGAVLDVWQADAAGRYDDTGWRLRGVLRSDEAGRYAIETIVPGGVEGAEPVVHIKASEAVGGRVLTTAVPVDQPVIRFDVVIEVG
jgi:protocatechuate 3,4-dioxygenase beta subunit